MKDTTYPHNEQIEYSTYPERSLGGQLANSSELPALICNAALRRELLPRCRLGFPCECINFFQRVSRLPDRTPTTEEIAWR